MAISPVEDIIADAKSGRMFIVVDDAQRENEGDLIIPAQLCNPQHINFMAAFGRGLICLALDSRTANRLQLLPMPQRNNRQDTAFTISIEARLGVSTGISAYDRARTISVATSPDSSADDISTPGHVFPLIAKDGGVIERQGRTEAAVDIARLAGLYPAGVICEIMKDDGTMARMPDLIGFSIRHNLRICTIASLVQYVKAGQYSNLTI